MATEFRKNIFCTGPLPVMVKPVVGMLSMRFLHAFHLSVLKLVGHMSHAW